LEQHIYHHDKGYEQLRIPSHPRASKYNKLVYRHIVIYEEYYKCCVLRWGDVHHINGIKDDNRIQNLQLLGKKQHNYITHYINMLDRKCSQCGNTKVRIDKNTGRPIWHWYNEKLLCNKCYRKTTYNYVKVKEDKRFRRKDTSDRVCANCGSPYTYIHKTHKVWFKGDKEGEFLCSYCGKKKYR
jgi:HNH endonuclease